MKKITAVFSILLLSILLGACGVLPTGETKVAQATSTVQSVQAMYTPYPTQIPYTPIPTQTVYPTQEQPTLPPVSNGWEINELDLKDDPIVAAWLPKVQAPSPLLWPTFPNVSNPKAPGFKVANGVEYGQDISPFCEQDQRCDWVVPAWSYRLILGDYKFTSPKFNYSCVNVEGQPRKGCLIVLFNVMNESYIWRNESVDNGFSVTGRYWNGDELQWAVWGLTSYASANMLNFPTMRDPTTGKVLNAGGGSSNAGANCGVQPNACGTVDVVVIVHAGDRILATMHTVVSK